MSIANRLPTVVIGAGVVGLACARALSRQGKEVVILDSEATIGTGTSSRNSEVIHAGLYYPPGSLKARTCVRGKELLYNYCASKDIPHKRIGKVIVATEGDEVPALRKIKAQAEANGVRDLKELAAADVKAYEPEVHAVAGLFSPSTGIIDSHSLMLSLLGDAESHGAVLAPHSRVVAGTVARDGSVTLEVASTSTGDDATATYTLDAEFVVNAAGLHAVQVASSISGGRAAAQVPRAYYCKGNYFTLDHGRRPFKHLVYPVPNNAGLGVHVTIDLAGNVRFGPDTQWVEDIDYSVSAASAAQFEQAIRRYWPGLPESSLVPTYCGIRPKIAGPSQPAADFMIMGPSNTGGRLVHLLGIESPGLTASLAIAELVAQDLANA